MRGFIFLWFGVTLCAAGCGSQDLKEVGDEFVRQKVLADANKREAIPFFEKQGRFIDAEGGTTTVDRDVVLPLLKQLREVAPTEQWVTLKPDETALYLLIELPDNAHTVDRMAKAVEEADANFSGFIAQQWGHKWLSINFYDKETYETLKKANPNIDKQR